MEKLSMIDRLFRARSLMCVDPQARKAAGLLGPGGLILFQAGVRKEIVVRISKESTLQKSDPENPPDPPDPPDQRSRKPLEVFDVNRIEINYA